MRSTNSRNVAFRLLEPHSAAVLPSDIIVVIGCPSLLIIALNFVAVWALSVRVASFVTFFFGSPNCGEDAIQSREVEIRELMLAGLAGDKAAYESMLLALARMLQPWFARRMANGSVGPEDLVQECLIAVHQKRATYDAARRFLPWVHAIARHKLVDHYRRCGAAGPAKPLEEADCVAEFENECIARMDVETLLSALPSKQCAAIAATKLRGESVAEVAAATGLSVSDVKVSVHRGMKSLAEKIKRRDR